MANFTQTGTAENTAIITVVGVGGAGVNAVNHMIAKGLQDVAFVAADTDAQALGGSLAKHKISMGRGKGLGTKSNLRMGFEAAMESREAFTAVLDGTDMVFVVAGMGGSTGGGAAPAIAHIAKQLGCLTVGLVSRPFFFEGETRLGNSRAGIQTFFQYADSLVVLPNDRLLQLAPEKTRYTELLERADELLYLTVKGSSDLILRTGLICIDFSDVRSVLQEPGEARVGIGHGTGENRARKAALMAIDRLLLDDVPLDRAGQVLLSIAASADVGIDEISDAAEIISQAVRDDVHVIFGVVRDDEKIDEFCATVIATGIRTCLPASYRPRKTRQSPGKEERLSPACLEKT